MKTNTKTKTYLDYAKTNMKSFDEEPFNEIDSAIFSWLVYMSIHENTDNQFNNSGMPIADLFKMEYFKEMFTTVYWPEESFELLVSVISNPRYRDARIKYYRYENDLKIALQFSALTISFKEGFNVVIFRGTDKSIHGWKEDIKVAMNRAAPCQLMAVNYLNSVASKIDGPIIVGGHSKGGNMAVYAASHADKEVRERITDIYSHDGPGFTKIDLKYSGMIEIKDRIHKMIPYQSIVGLLMNNETTPEYIVSLNKGLLQHYPGSWVVEGNHFKIAKRKSQLANKLMGNVNRWLESVDDHHKEKFMNCLFEIIESSGVDDLNEIFDNQNKYLKFYLKAYINADPQNKKIIKKDIIDALRGKTKNNAELDEKLKHIDFDNVETLLNELETKEFNEKYNLFI